MTPKEIGARIYEQHSKSAFTTKEITMMVLENAAARASDDVMNGFFEAEMTQG